MSELPKLDPDAGIYLALGGGAARGFAHLGALIALERAKIPIAGICGTSMGSLVGACYSLLPKAETVAADFVHYIKSAHFNQVRYAFMKSVQRQEGRRNSIRERLRQGLLVGKSFATGGVISFDDFRSEISSLVPDKTFSDTVLPFFSTAVDLTEIREVVINGGYLRSAVMASSAVPGAFPPVQSGGSIYVDGGWMNRVPVNPLLAFGARRVLALDVSDADPPTDINTKRGYAVLNLANKATRERLHEIQVERADLVWRLPVQDIHWADFVSIERAIELGMQYAEEHMHEIYPLIDPPKPPPWWRRLAKRIAGEESTEPRYSFIVRSMWDVSKSNQILKDDA